LNHYKVFKNEQNVYCPHCDALYIDNSKLWSNEPIQGICTCKDCGKSFIVTPDVKRVYVYKTRAL
jgi:transcription elongation factor Elf1